MEQDTRPPVDPDHLLGGQVAHYRRLKHDERGKPWSQRRLADELDQLGYPLSDVLICRIEKGDRSVSISELMALGYALDVPPLLLLFPMGELRARSVKITPSDARPPSSAARWFAGRQSLRRDAEYTANAVPLTLFNELDELVGTANYQALNLLAQGDSGRLVAFDDVVSKLVRHVERMVRDWRLCIDSSRIDARVIDRMRDHNPKLRFDPEQENMP